MNKLKYLLSAFVLLCFASCKDDPWEDVADGGWNHERSIIDVKFEGQAGTPTITETDSETGVIELQLASDMVADMSKVRVETLTLSYKATANVASGGTIDFTKGDPQIVVTSPNGESRTYTLEMTEFTETLTGTYTISNLWVYGGTGAAYDCTKLYKPTDKSWCWNGEGRGPAAEMDNYLVFTLGEILADGNTTGTCMNWAGEDAKNWDCVFAGASNPDTGKPVDLTQFYRQIPKGESTWLRNYSDGTITFTDADGNKTSCTLVPKGTYQMPNVPPIPLTLESEAFKFNLKGTEDWNNTYNDYGVFARNPVTYYIEIVKQPAGFEVPEASKTIEEPVDPEPEPEPDPEETSLAGTYSVGRLTVYGGSADPAFVNPADKSWVWDDSIGKADPFQQPNNRQIQKSQSIYSHQLCHRQCLHFEHSLKRRDHQYSCNQKPAKYKCSDQINVIPESFRKNDRFVCFTVKSVNQTAAAKCSKCHRTCQHCISIAISDHKCCHGHDSDTQTFHSDACKKWFCQNGLSMARGFSFITSGLCGSSPSAIAGRLSVRRLMNSRCTGANGTGRLASDAYKTARIAAKFPESKN